MEEQDVKRIIKTFAALRKSMAAVNESLDDFEKAFRAVGNDLKLYDCVAFIMTRRNKDANLNGSKAGYANGYVAVPPEHVYFGKSYYEVDVAVHGGLTFAEYADRVKKYWDEFSDDIEFIDGATEIPSGWYIFGFDTLHYNDSLETCPKEYCIAETINLKKQLDCAFL